MIKRQILLCTALLAIVLMGGCDSSGTNTSSDFFFEARLNGDVFSGKAWAQFDENSTDHLYVAGNEHRDLSSKNYTGNPPENQLGFTIREFDEEGTYPIRPGQGGYITLIGGDVLNESYKSYGADSDRVVVTEFDRDQKIIQGTVEMRLKNTEDSSDIIQVASGRFRAQVTQK